jgi:hypothetical protein
VGVRRPVALGCHRAGPTGVASGWGCWRFGALCRARGGGGVLSESAADAKSAAIEPPTTTGETTDAPLLQPIEPAVAAPTPSVAGAVEGVVRGAGPPPPACCCRRGRGSSAEPARHGSSGARRLRGRDKSCLPPRARRP